MTKKNHIKRAAIKAGLPAIKAGEYYKLKSPGFVKSYGQGEKPKGIIFAVNNKKYFLKFGAIFKASANCDSENKFGSLDAEPYPLLRVEIIEELKDQFEYILLTKKSKSKEI